MATDDNNQHALPENKVEFSKGRRRGVQCSHNGYIYIAGIIIVGTTGAAKTEKTIIPNLIKRFLLTGHLKYVLVLFGSLDSSWL